MQLKSVMEQVSDPHTDSTEVNSEIQEYAVIHQQRRKLLPRAALVGLCSGLVASLFRIVLGGADALRNALVTWSHQVPVMGWIFPILFSATGALISLVLVRHFAPDAKGSGIPHLKAVQYRLRTINWKRILPVKFVSGVFALGSGLALGREGPTVQMGGAIGDLIADLLKSQPRERLTLIAAGAGAGLAAAFNAPLSGLTFVLEEVQRDFQPIVFGATFIACVVANIVARALTGSMPVFTIPAYAALPLTALPFFVVLGAAAGFAGVLFNRGLVGSLSFFARFGDRSRIIAAAVMGALVGVTSWFSPVSVGSGHAMAEIVLAGQFLLASLPFLFGLRFFLTIFSYGTGTAGGIFAPMLVLGALLGLGVGQLGHSLAPDLIHQPAVFAVVGMAAFFTAVVRAPLTGILLIVEMTGNYEQMLPLLVSCFCAYAVAELLNTLPIYEELLERDLAASDNLMNLKEPMIVDFEVESGAPFEGKEVRHLGLPPGCVLMCIMDGCREFVPTATTRLEAYMRVRAVIAPEAANSLEIMRHGCKSAQ